MYTSAVTTSASEQTQARVVKSSCCGLVSHSGCPRVRDGHKLMYCWYILVNNTYLLLMVYISPPVSWSLPMVLQVKQGPSAGYLCSQYYQVQLQGIQQPPKVSTMAVWRSISFLGIWRAIGSSGQVAMTSVTTSPLLHQSPPRGVLKKTGRDFEMGTSSLPYTHAFSYSFSCTFLDTYL